MGTGPEPVCRAVDLLQHGLGIGGSSLGTRWRRQPIILWPHGHLGLGGRPGSRPGIELPSGGASVLMTAEGREKGQAASFLLVLNM